MMTQLRTVIQTVSGNRVILKAHSWLKRKAEFDAKRRWELPASVQEIDPESRSKLGKPWWVAWGSRNDLAVSGRLA